MYFGQQTLLSKDITHMSFTNTATHTRHNKFYMLVFNDTKQNERTRARQTVVLI